MRNRLFVLTLALLPLAAAAQEYPRLKPGSWELNRTSDHPGPGGGMHMTLCIDEASQKEMWDMGVGAMKGFCSKADFHISGGKGTGDFVCDMGGTKMHTKSTLIMTGDTGYRTDMDTTFDPPLGGRASAHSTLEARYTGPCKAGQRPGDMTLPNGQTINMRDMAGGRTPPPAPPK